MELAVICINPALVNLKRSFKQEYFDQVDTTCGLMLPFQGCFGTSLGMTDGPYLLPSSNIEFKDMQEDWGWYNYW